MQYWARMTDAMPDAIPVISTVGSRPGLVIATGSSGHGFGLGPAVDLVLGNDPAVDPQPSHDERFIGGMRPRPTTGV